MRRSLFVGCALFLGASVAWAEDKPKSDEVPKEVVQKIIKRWKEARGCCHREDIPEALSNQVRQGTVQAKDKPLTVGETAPKLEGLPDKRPLAVVFYRGHW
jgi:hypothetical protein